MRKEEGGRREGGRVCLSFIKCDKGTRRTEGGRDEEMPSAQSESAFALPLGPTHFERVAEY